jgi:hypothetical protein
MEHISGETNYIPPPLSNGEILAGIVGFLDKEVVKRRPSALDRRCAGGGGCGRGV